MSEQDTAQPEGEEKKAEQQEPPPQTKVSQDIHQANAPVFGRDNYAPINISWAQPGPNDPVEGPVESSLLTHAETIFCPPENFDVAKKTLSEDHLVVLRGHGCGRTHTALRLLLETCDGTISRLDPQASAQSFHPAEADKTAGYIWDGVTTSPWLGEAKLHRVLERLQDRLKQANSRLVVVIENLETTGAGSALVELRPPAVQDLVRAHLGAFGTHYEELVDKLGDVSTIFANSSPARAKFIADCLTDLHHGIVDAETTRATLLRDGNDDIAKWFEQAGLGDRCLALATAFFENSPCQSVLGSAEELTKTLSNPENGEIWPYDPPDLFELSIDERLGKINAIRHREPTELPTTDSRVRFLQRGWGQRLINYVWSQYEAVRPFVENWLATKLRLLSQKDNAGTRYGRMLRNAKQGDAFRRILALARSETYTTRYLAAAAMNGLAEDPRLGQVVNRFLADWVRSGDEAERVTAALTWQGPLGSTRPGTTMFALRLLANGAGPRLRGAIQEAIASLLREKHHRIIVQKSLLAWDPQNASARRFHQNCLLLAIGLYRRPDPSFHADPQTFHHLLSSLLADDNGKRRVVKLFNDWSKDSARGIQQARLDGQLVAALRGPDRVVGERLAFVVRKALFEQPQEFEPLRVALQRVL